MRLVLDGYHDYGKLRWPARDKPCLTLIDLAFGWYPGGVWVAVALLGFHGYVRVKR